MNSVEKLTLQGEGVILRDATPLDVTARFALGNTPEIQAMFGADPAAVRDITPEAAEAWVQSHIDDAYAWIIEAGGALGRWRTFAHHQLFRQARTDRDRHCGSGRAWQRHRHRGDAAVGSTCL